LNPAPTLAPAKETHLISLLALACLVYLVFAVLRPEKF
jgi:K+-transporting ATPase KdpF subunit